MGRAGCGLFPVLGSGSGWASEAGHLLAPLHATHQGYRVGIWLKNARAAVRKTQETEQRQAEGLPIKPSAGALSDERREHLEDIDPVWCPVRPVEWQRSAFLSAKKCGTERRWRTTGRSVPEGCGVTTSRAACSGCRTRRPR
ncbi:helicase associated domain-containing protein [Streptomyces sp. YIM S03343]